MSWFKCIWPCSPSPVRLSPIHEYKVFISNGIWFLFWKDDSHCEGDMWRGPGWAARLPMRPEREQGQKACSFSRARAVVATVLFQSLWSEGGWFQGCLWHLSQPCPSPRLRYPAEIIVFVSYRWEEKRNSEVWFLLWLAFILLSQFGGAYKCSRVPSSPSSGMFLSAACGVL